MTPKMNEINLPDDLDLGDVIDSYLPVPPIEPEYPETPAKNKPAISTYTVNKVKKEDKKAERNHLSLYEVKKVPRTEIHGRDLMGVSEFKVNKVAPKGPEKKYETVFTFDSKVKKAPKKETVRENAVQSFDLYTRKVPKKEKEAPKRIMSYEDRDEKVGELHFEKADKRHINSVGQKKS